ncbi:MAG: hypothetical protein WC533_01045 [Candidatus Pacearchaeota archaeon]
MGLMISKKGMGHVEMVISFAIFTGFVIFLFSILNPFQRPENPGIVDNVYYGLEDEFKTTITAVPIKILSETPTEECFRIASISGFCGGSNEKIIIKNKDEEIVAAEKSEGGFNFVKNIGADNFITIYCSEELNENPVSCKTYKTLDATGYDSGIITSIDAWSKTKINSGSYNEIKAKILGANKEFKTTFKYILGDIWKNISASSDAPKGAEIYAKSYPIDVLENNSTISKNMLIIQVW